MDAALFEWLVRRVVPGIGTRDRPDGRKSDQACNREAGPRRGPVGPAPGLLGLPLGAGKLAGQHHPPALFGFLQSLATMSTREIFLKQIHFSSPV